MTRPSYPASNCKLKLAGVQNIPQQVAVAWSGGLDSTALLLCLKEQGFEVQAWHVDHGWHEESAIMAESLAEQAEKWGIPFYLKCLTKPERNFESQARSGRYQAFAQLAQETGCFQLALAHQADDQAETVCMRMLQGAGVAGCRGMQVHRKRQLLHLWRPLLHIPRAKLMTYLQQQGASWLDDPSNEDLSLWRNKIRKRLFPLMRAGGVDPLALFLRWQQQAVKVHDQIVSLAETIKVEKISQANGEACRLDWESWCAAAPPVRAFLLQKMAGLLFAEGVVLGRRHILAIEQWREHGGNSWLNLSGCCLYRGGKDLHLCKGKLSLRHSFSNAQ